MLLWWTGKLNEGSLPRRTPRPIGMLVLGSACFVALASAALVATTKALLPSHDATDMAVTAAEEEPDANAASPEAAASTDRARHGRKAYAQRRAPGRGGGTGVR
ncbi:hypothetical protein WMF30_32335 [Sorangium sp. So ce134]